MSIIYHLVCYINNIALWKLTPNTPVCHAQSEQKAWDLKSSTYGQLLKHCYFKYKEKKEWIWSKIYWCEKRKYLIALISQNEKFDHWFKLFRWKYSSPLENTIPPCDSDPLQENKKVPALPFLRMLQNFQASPAERWGGTMATLTKGGFLWVDSKLEIYQEW